MVAIELCRFRAEENWNRRLIWAVIGSPILLFRVSLPSKVHPSDAKVAFSMGSPTISPSSSLTTTAQRELQSNWVAYAYWHYSTTATPIAFFGTDWTVPAAPTSWDGQLLYWFNGLQPGGWNEILQPVLQYGISPAGGGNIFAIASWWLVGLEVYHSGIIEVFPGTELQGHMALTGISTSDGVTTYSYSSYFPGYSIPTINASTTHVLSVASEVLEIYNAQTVSDLPSGSTDFTAVDIKFNDNSHMSTIPWTVANDATDGISMSVISYSGTDGHLRLTY